MPIAGVIDDEVQPRPVLRRLADIADIGKRQQVRKLLSDRRCEQTLMDTDIFDAGPLKALVGRIHQLFVVQPPRVMAVSLMGVVADGVALPAIRPQRRDGMVDAVEPPRLSRY